MPELLLHGRPVRTVFQLLGVSENNITFSLGWTMRECPSLCSAVLKEVAPSAARGRIGTVRLQEYAHGAGITDVELEVGSARVIFEAKRGWVLPTPVQLAKYALRHPTAIVVLSECSREFATARLPAAVNSIPVVHLSWREIAELVRRTNATATRAQRRALDAFATYLEGAMPVQDKESNLVFVVSLGSGKPDGAKVSWIDIVEKHDRYFHPVGDGWPKEPPNYVGYRYQGRLQCIRHVDAYVQDTNPAKYVQGMPSKEWQEPHFFYELGPRIAPAREVLNGSVYPSGRVWAAIDLLLTCASVSDAVQKTKDRLEKAPGE